MANSIYALPTDNVASAGTPTLATGTADSAYPLANIYDTRPDKPFKITAAAEFRITWDRGSAQTPGIVSLHNIKLDAALNVRWQMHTANSWGTPDIDVAITIPAATGDGKRANPFLDTSALTAKRYWSLYAPANSVVPVIGEIGLWLTKRSLTRNFSYGLEQTERRAVIEHVTEVEVSTVYDYGVTLKRITARWVVDNDTTLPELRTWWRATKGRVTPSLFILEPSVNEALLMRAASDLSVIRSYPDVSEVSVTLTEVSPGVPI